MPLDGNLNASRGEIISVQEKVINQGLVFTIQALVFTNLTLVFKNQDLVYRIHHDARKFPS